MTRSSSLPRWKVTATRCIAKTSNTDERSRVCGFKTRSCNWKCSLREPHLHIRAFLQVNAVDEAHFASAVSQDDRRSSRALTKESYAFEQCAFGYAGGGEDQLLAGREIFGFVNSVFIFDSHAGNTLFQFRFVDNQTT